MKVLSNIRVFYPNREDFDFSRAVEFAYSPLHHVFGRGEDITGRTFFRDIVRAQLEPDLNAYRGFEIDPSITAEGLISENWGKTFMMHEGDRSFQGIYVGAGPYLAARAYAEFDSELVNLLNSPVDTYLPAASFGIGGGETDQLALAITGGYRARFPNLPSGGDGGRPQWHVCRREFPLPARSSPRRLQVRTCNSRPTRLASCRPIPRRRPLRSIGTRRRMAAAWPSMLASRSSSIAGTSALVWAASRTGSPGREIKRHHLSLLSLFGGTEFVNIRLPPTDEKHRLELPVTYTGDLAYHRERWSVFTEYSHGFMGNQFRTGMEYRLGAVELRGAGRYYDGSWYPSVGAGFNLTRNFGVDAASSAPRRSSSEAPTWVGHFLSHRQEVAESPAGHCRSLANQDERSVADEV